MRMSKSDKWFYFINGLLLTLIASSCLIPLLHVFSLSLSSSRAIESGDVSFIPIEITMDSFDILLEGSRVLTAFRNSVVITVIGMLLSMAATILTAYPLSRRSLPGRKYLTLAAVFTMIFSGGMIPTFIVVHGLGLINSYWAIWLPALVSTYLMLIMKSFNENIPVEIEEAGRIDGCNEWGMLFRIFLPLSVPVLATLSLFYAVGYWNVFMPVLLYINDTTMYNLTVLIQNMIRSTSVLNELGNYDAVGHLTPEGVKAAGVILLLIPMLAVYPFVQRYFVQGVMLGAVKG
jgi:putative aldouronate transport system permease protein